MLNTKKHKKKNKKKQMVTRCHDNDKVYASHFWLLFYLYSTFAKLKVTYQSCKTYNPLIKLSVYTGIGKQSR